MVGVFDAIKRGFGIAAKSLGLVLILIVFNLIWNFVSMPFAITPGQAPTNEAMFGAVIFTLIFMLISIFVQGGALGLVRDMIKEGKMKLDSFVSYGAKYYVKLLGLGALIILIIGIVALLAAVIIAVTGPLNSVLISAIAIAIAVVIGIAASLYYFIPFSLSPYVLICEGLGVIASIKRSLVVVKTPFSRVFLLILLFAVLILISLGIGVVLGFIVGMISAVIPAMAGKILMAVVTSVINGYLGIVMMAAFMTYYLGLAANTEKKVV